MSTYEIQYDMAIDLLQHALKILSSQGIFQSILVIKPEEIVLREDTGRGHHETILCGRKEIAKKLDQATDRYYEEGNYE